MNKQKRKKNSPAASASAESISHTAPTSTNYMPQWDADYRELILAIGVGLLIFCRPWRDGITFPDDNFQFMWVVSALVVLLASRLLFKRQPVRYATPTGILLAFLAVCFLTAFSSVQKDATIRSLVIWTGQALLFFVALNGLRSRSAVAIVLGFLVVSSIAESLWSIIHVRYVMPMTREDILRDPTMLMKYFGATEMTDAIKSRLESNRATGTLLFANALACWNIATIPLAIGGAVSGAYRLRHILATAKASLASPTSTDEKQQSDAFTNAAIAGMTTAVLLFLVGFVTYSFYVFFAFRSETMLQHYIGTTIFCLVLPVSIGWMGVSVSRKYGIGVWLLYIQTYGFAFMVILQTFVLGYTFSRGAMLAVVIALALMAWLVRGAPSNMETFCVAAVRAVAVWMVVIASLVFAVHAKAQAPVNPAPPSTPQTQSATPPVNHAPSVSVPLAPTIPGQKKPDLAVQGMSYTEQQFLSPATAFLRFSYWGSGARMAAHNLLKGVGLGNFGTVYPMYQYLGAGDVQQAHNDFLQVLCETGIFGFLFFTTFWGYFVFYGVRRIRKETDRIERWWLAGIFCGVVAFLLHSIVDFNFSNPSLVALVMLLAALFYARATHRGEASIRVRWSPVAAIVALLLTSLAVGYSLEIIKPIRTQAAGDETIRKARIEAANFILDRYHAFQNKKPESIAMPYNMAKLIFPDRSMLESIGKPYARLNAAGTQARPVQPGESIPPNTYLIIQDVNAARQRLLEQIPLWIEIFKECDGAYPYDPKLASYIWQWYDIRYKETGDPAEKIQYADECLAWAKESAQRSPYQIPYSNLLGRALWRRGSVETTVAQLKYYDDGLSEFKHTIDLYPNGPLVYFEYADRCREYGQQLVNAGDNKRGNALLAEAETMHKKAEEMQKEADRRTAAMNS